jgi:colanic acid/amylovoran biosynthesis glycosyltransferase
MKILFVVGQFPVLSETFILNQITGLIDRGHEVHIYAIRKTGGALHDDVEKYDLFKRTFFGKEIPGGKIKRYYGALRLACKLVKSNPEILLRAVNAIRYRPRFSFLMIFFDLNSLNALSHYDVINCHFGHHGIRGMMLREIGALQGKLITTFHGGDISFGLQKAGRKIYNSLFKRGDLFLPVSERWRKRLVELGCDETKIQVHRMGIDCRKFTFKPRLPDPNGAFKIVTVARMMEKKGLEFGIRAFAGLRKYHGNAEYTIIGDGPLRARLESLVDKLDFRKCVRMVGAQKQHRVIEILDSSHVFMLPSVTAANGDQEGLPVALMEAMAMGLPVVSTFHSGIPELVEDGLSGFLVPEKDVNGLFEKLKYLAENPERWAEMGHHGRKIVEAHYDINLLNDKLVEIFHQLLRNC